MRRRPQGCPGLILVAKLHPLTLPLRAVAPEQWSLLVSIRRLLGEALFPSVDRAWEV